jgi:hypothetical protein
MSKSRTPNYTPEQVGVAPGLDQNPIVQQNNAARDAESARLNEYTPKSKDSIQAIAIGDSPREYNIALERGVQLGSDAQQNEYAMGNAQPIGEQIGSAIARFAPMVAIDIAKQVSNLGSFGEKMVGVDDALRTSNKDSFDSYIDDVESNLKKALPIHSTDAYDNGNPLRKIFTSKFWTEDIADGAAFVTALAFGSKGLGAVAGVAGEGLEAVSKSSNLAELYQAVPITQKIATAVAQGFTTATVGFLNAASISAMQAKGTANQIEQKMRATYSQKVNPETGDFYTQAETDKEIARNKTLIDEKTDNTFWATMATELLPSMFASKMFLGAGKAEMGEFNSKLMKAVDEGKLTLEDLKSQLSPEILQKAGIEGVDAYNALKKGGLTNNLIEAGKAGGVGALAMNLQTSIQKYDVDQATAGISGGVLGSSMGYARQFLDNFTTDEGIKGLVIGGLLGTATGAFHGISGNAEYNEGLKNHLVSMRASDALFGEIPKDQWKTDKEGKLIFDKNDQPIPDPDKIYKLVFQGLQDKNLMDNQGAAILANSPDMATMNEHVALAQMIAKELQSGRYSTTAETREYFKWFHKTRITEQSLKDIKDERDAAVDESAKDQSPDPEAASKASAETNSAMKSGSAKGDASISKLVNDNAQLIDKMLDLWDTTGKQSNRNARIGQSEEVGAFNDNVRRALYYEGVKREAMKEMLLDKEAAMKEVGADREGLNKETETIANLITDSEKRSSDMLNKDSGLFDKWNEANKSRTSLLNEAMAAQDKFKDASTEENARSRDTADYKLSEHAAKEGLTSTTGLGGTDTFIGNESMGNVLGTNIGTRNELQYKAGLDYLKLGRVQDMIAKVKSGELPLSEAVKYATDNLTKIDDTTRGQLNDLIKEQQDTVTTDEETLGKMDSWDEEANAPKQEYDDLEKSIQERKDAIAKAGVLLSDKAQTEELDTVNRGPEKVEETLNRQFAERHFEKANNVVTNATDSAGNIRKEYTDSRAVSSAIDQLTRMRNAMEDRVKDGDLKGQTGYNDLIERADEKIKLLTKIAKSVAENDENRKFIQQKIANDHAYTVANSIGYDLQSGSVTNEPIFNAAAAILGGTEELQMQLDALLNLRSGNIYEGSNAILHALKTKADKVGLAALSEMIDEQIATHATEIPNTTGTAKYLKGLQESPELHLTGILLGLTEPGYSQIKLDKGTPFGDFLADNDIEAFKSAIDAMPEDAKDLGASKETVLKVLDAYKAIVGLNRTKNLLNSDVDLSKTVAAEIKTAGDSSGIVPTTQQEIAIRDGLAWIGSDKPVGTNKFDGWGFLRGIAGTGKTTLTVKWLLELADLKPEEILATAATETSAEVLRGSTKGDAIVFKDMMEGEIPAGKKLIILDEYARITTAQLKEFEAKVREHNSKLDPKDRVKVMILGDPTQPKPELHSNKDIANPASNPGAKNIRVINPLTIVYRSDVSAVDEAWRVYQGNSQPVENVNVRSDKDKGIPGAIGVHTASSSGDIIDTVKANVALDKENGTTRTRAIITQQPSKYTAMNTELRAAGLPEVPIINVYDSQSQTFQEAYVDLDPKDFYNTDQFNSVMYAGISRAKEYAQFIHVNKDGSESNTKDASGLYAEKANNDLQASQAKEEYVAHRTEEKVMMDKAAKGESIDIPETEAAIELAKTKSSVEKEAADPDSDTKPDGQEIVTEIDGEDIPDLEHDVHEDDYEAEIAAEAIPDTTEGVQQLANIEAGADKAMSHVKGEGRVKAGDTVHYMYTEEPPNTKKNRTTAEPSVTAFVIDSEGNWIPISKVFKDEINKIPKYAKWKKAIEGMQPMKFDPTRFNNGIYAATPLEDMLGHKLGEATITKAQRLTYKFKKVNSDLKDSVGKVQTLATYIKNKFKDKYYSPRDTEQAKADGIVFRIFRNNEFSGSKQHRFKDGVARPIAGIPYAIVGGKPGTNDWSEAQFIRLTANPLNKNSTHYEDLKAFKDAVDAVATATGKENAATGKSVRGIEPGTNEFNKMVRAAKKGLTMEDTVDAAGRGKKVGISKDFTVQQFLDAYEKAGSSKEPFVDPLKHLSEDDAKAAVSKMQYLASLVYGVRDVPAEMTKAEMLAAHGDGYEHVPLLSGKTKEVTTEIPESTTNPKETVKTQEPLGNARLKGTGPKTGRPEDLVKHPEFDNTKGKAQIAFNQIAKANEYVGSTRIRVDENKTVGRDSARIPRPTGKSLITGKGGDSQEWMPRKVLAQILGETQVAQEKLSPSELSNKETKKDLESQVRAQFKEHGGTVEEFGHELLAKSGLSEEKQAELLGDLETALSAKDTKPVTMDTLNLLVGDENYDAAGNHLTKDSFNITNKRGDTSFRQTYVRTPLGIDEFNKLGASPETNAEALSKMVGTKFDGILPTSVSVINKGDGEISLPKTEPVKKTTTVPADKQHIQDKIDALQDKITNAKNALERVKLNKEQRALINERDSTSRMFDETVHRTDVGDKITITEATAEIKRMLPNTTDSEINFLNRSLMLELQQPGESLLGLYQKGKMFFKQEPDGTVFSNVVRHEVFHKVYNDYLSNRDRSAISKEFDPEGKMTPIQLEEALADKFMVWKSQPETVTGKIKRIFNKILGWLNFAQDNQGTIDKLFNDIQNGKFQKVDPETSNSRRAFSDISKWGTHADYKNASRYLQNKIYDYYVDEHIDKMPLTQKELISTIQKHMAEDFNFEVDKLDGMLQDSSELTDMLAAAETPLEKSEIKQAIIDNNSEALKIAQKRDMLGGFLKEKMMQDIWKDIYPSFNFKDSGILSLIEEDPINEIEEDAAKSKDSSVYQDHVESADEKNQETKISTNVKNFLSFIYRGGKDKEGNTTRVNPRGVYLLALRNLSNMETGAPDFIEQLKKRAAQNGIKLDNHNNDATLVINTIIALHANATNKDGIYVMNKGRNSTGLAEKAEIKLPESGRFLSEDKFVKSMDNTSIAHITKPNTDLHMVTDRLPNESTGDFLNRVLTSGVSMREAKGYFRQYQAQETLREVMSNFASQREAIPMIAEETRDFDGTTLKYMRAQIKGEERVETAKIENAIKEKWHQAIKDNWTEFQKAVGKKKGTAIANLMSSLGLDAEHVRMLDSNLVDTVHQDILSLKNTIDKTKTELNKIAVSDASDSDEQTTKADPVYVALEQNSNMLNRLTRLLSMTSSDNRAGAYIDSGGTKKYLFHNGSQAHDVISKMVQSILDNIGALPDHFKDKILSKNIFVNGMNVISSMLDHDGYRQEGKEEFAVQYSGESNKNWLERNFSYGFLSYLDTNTSNNDTAAEYVQPFYTISNRPRMNMATVRVLSEAQIHDALIKGIEQHLEQPDTKLFRNYDKYKAVNFDEVHKAIKGLHGVDVETLSKTKEGRVQLSELYKKLSESPELKAELATHMVEQLKELAGKSFERMKKEGIVFGDNALGTAKKLKDTRRAVLTADELDKDGKEIVKTPDEQMKPVVENYYMNNYVNSYFLNQAVIGNMNYFKNALDVVKRMSGVFAPGTKGLVGKFFMNAHFNIAVGSDPKMTADMLSPIFKDRQLQKALKAEGFDLADAQGFMTQQRADNILQGYGQNYKAGSVFKPAHYENAPRTLEDGSTVYAPVMLKYSSVVLTDDLVNKFPKLKELRDEMLNHKDAKGRSNPIDEFVMNSGVKVGAPESQVDLSSDGKIRIKPESVIKLKNENYRLQLNPSKEEFDHVANPTQLGYFLNIMHKMGTAGILNRASADKVYAAVADKMNRGMEKLGKSSLTANGEFTVSSIVKGLTGPGNERVQEMVKKLENLNMPSAADKALITMAGLVDKAAPKVEFPGGKMVLQSSFGITTPDAEGKPRRLMYQQDPVTKRWHAEIMLPEIYRKKANPGDFVLPDGMGFRIPSTELHSSLPFKIVGFHNEGNVVIAPAELVEHHGSDFDVDSLSIITRAQAKSNVFEGDTAEGTTIIEKGNPVGYYKNADGKYEFDEQRFLNHINDQKIKNADNEPFLKKLEKLHDQLLLNKITEAFLDTISHEDNIDRMLTPISTEVIKTTLKELGIEEDKNVNLSRLEDNLKVYNSNFQGAALTGIFANGPKALSYLSRAGVEGEYPELTPNAEGAPALAFDWNGKVYDKFTEEDHTGGNLWQQLDSFINTAVDNVKEQYLHLMNATDKTGPAFIAAKAMGMPLKEVVRMMRQPVVRLFSEQIGGKQKSIDNLKKAIVEHAIGMKREDGSTLLASEQGYTDLRTALKGEVVELNDKYLDSQLGSDKTLGATPNELAHQMAVLDRFESVNKIGQDLSVFSSALSILQRMPAFYEEVQDKVNQWAALGEIKDGKLTTNKEFSFNIDNLLQAQPNIAEAYEAFQKYKDAADKTLIKHFPEMSALVDTLSDSKLKLLSDPSANREKIKNEVMSYLISTYYGEDLKGQKPVAIGPDKSVILTGRHAWSEDFTKQVEAATKDKTINNAFLKRMTIKKNKYGDSIRFANSSNPDAEEALEMQEAFNAIPDAKLKADFVKYAVLNYGLNFGMRNYSMFIPPEYLESISSHISKEVRGMVKDSQVDQNGTLVSGPLKNIRDLMAIKMAVNFPDKLPFISAGKTPALQSTDEAGKPKFVMLGDKPVRVLSGYDGSYYWHRMYDNPNPDEAAVGKFPEFIRQRDGNSREVVYRRLNDPAADSKVFYQRVAYKNYSGGYDGSMDIVRKGYDPDAYFAKGTIPVPVPDISAAKFETRNEHIEENSHVIIYPHSNATREQGISGIVDKVTPGLNGKISFTLKKGPELSKELDGETPDVNRDHLLNIATKVLDQVGLKLEVSDKLPNGVKGSYEDGKVTLDPKRITPDTVFHEVSHPLIAAIKEANPVWYEKLANELRTSTEGRTILSKVEAKYPELSKDGHEVEALVTAVGLESANRLEDSSFRTQVQRLMRSLGNMLRSVLGTSSVTKLDLNNIASADMLKLSIGDIAELLAGGKVDLRQLSSEGGDVQYSKDINSEEPAKGSIMSRIIEAAKSIVEPAVDEDGKQSDHYMVNAKPELRVSRAMDDFTFRTKQEMQDSNGKSIPAEDAIAIRDADRTFKNIEPGGKIEIDGVEKTKEEYQAEKKSMLLNGIAKGNIIHAKIQKFFADLREDRVLSDKLQRDIEDLSSKVGKLPTVYDWITDKKKGIFPKLMKNAGINIGSHVPKAQEDIVHSEVMVASPILGIAGKIDMLVEKSDGRFRLVDWKTGSKLKDKYSNTILKYGYQSTRITDNPLDRAKMQIMLYALTIKAEHPEARFDGLVVMHLPDEHEAVQGRNALSVEVPSYLKMLEQYYRHEKPEVYKQLLEKSPNIFDPREYNTPLRADLAQEVLNSNGSSETEVNSKHVLELQQLEYDIATQRKDNALSGPTNEQIQRRAELTRMIADYTDLYGADFSGGLDPSHEITIMKRWMGTLNDTHNPYVQSLNLHLKTREKRVHDEMAKVEREFEILVRPVMKERLGKTRGALQKAFTSVDYDKLFKSFYTKKVVEEDGVKWASFGLTNPVDHPAEYAALTSSEKALVDHIRTNMRGIYEDVMTKGEFAVVGMKDGKPITKEDLYNQSAKGGSFKMTDGFFPKMVLTKEEANTRLLKRLGKGDFSALGTSLTNGWRRFATDFFENNAEGYNQRDFGLTVRYLGNANTAASPDGYSMNLEASYKKFMEQMIRKKHLDSTYMYGQAVKGILLNATDGNGNPAFKLSAGLIEDQLRNILMKDTLNRGTGKFIRHGIAVGRKEGQERTISVLQIYKSLKSGVAAATLWLQPERSAVNLAQAMYMHGKEGLVNDVVAWANKREGLALNRDISVKGMGDSYAEAIAGQIAAFSGNGKSNFVHQLAKELKLYNNLLEEGGKQEQYLTKGCTLLDTSNLGFLYRIPEEITNVQYGLNYMKNLKIQSGKYAGKSMYDMYKENFNKQTGTFDLPADFKRGTLQHGDGTTEELGGLHALEINKIHAGIGKIMGNYRSDEKTALQMSILGDAMMMFKRWIPGMAVQQYQNKFLDPTMGSFELSNSLDQKPGEDKYEWRSRVVEGRMRTLGNFFMHMTGLSKYDGYAWSDLSSEQRKGLIDGGVAISTWLTMAVTATYALGHKKDNDTIKVLFAAMQERVQEEIWIPTMASAALQPPASVKKTQDALKALWQLLGAGTSAATGGENRDIYTERGDIKGMNQLMKNAPVFGGIYESHKSWVNWNNDDAVGSTSPF